MGDADATEMYRAAWEAWRKQVDHLHRVLLDGEPLGAPQMKGLLNREARAKEAYDRARAALLGVDARGSEPAADGSNPFR